MTDVPRRARTDTFEHTISGLLTKRADLFNEAERLRDRLAAIRNDLGAIDRTLGVLGYTGDLDAAMPRQKREVIFGKGELSRAIYGEIREAEGPLSSRDIARAIVAVRGDDPRDQKYLSDLTRRVGKALRVMKAEGNVKGMVDGRGSAVWTRATV